VLDVDRFSRLLDQIYECAVEPGGWPECLSAVAGATGCTALTVAIAGTSERDELAALWRSPDQEIGISASVDGRSLAGLVARSDEKLRRLPSPARATDGDIAACRFPCNDRQGLIVVELADGGTLDPLIALVPHLARAGALCHRLASLREGAERAAALLDCAASAVLLVDARMRVLHLNQAARVLLARRDCIATDGGIASAVDTRVALDLSAAVARAAGSQASASAIALRRADGTPVLIHVLPGGAAASRRTGPAFAVVIAVTAGAPQAAALAALSAMCGLTATETAVVREVASGRSPADAAETLGIGVATVRSHLLNVFDKTGTAGQAQLARLVATLKSA